MPRLLLRRIHVGASLAATAIVATFIAASGVIETLGSEHDVAVVKQWIVRAIVPLVVALAAAGLTGRRLAGGAARAPLLRRKQQRMQAITATGILVLVPCAVALDWLASNGRLGAAFTLVQTVELLAGTMNLVLLSLNLRDGLRLRTRRTAAQRAGQQRQPGAPA